jgi:hypothetical protein
MGKRYRGYFSIKHKENNFITETIPNRGGNLQSSIDGLLFQKGVEDEEKT